MTRYQAAVGPEDLQKLAAQLGLTAESLIRLGIGWATRTQILATGTKCRGAGTWTFPMRDPAGRITGIRLRTPSGFKYAVAGSTDGLFIPDELGPGDDLLTISEGVTDAASLLDLGFTAVGRSCCTGGAVLIVRLLRQLRPKRVVIMADRDANEVGQIGAERLARTLVPYVPELKLVVPPAGVKDVREWKRSGATASDVQSAIHSVPPLSVRIRAAGMRG